MKQLPNSQEFEIASLKLGMTILYAPHYDV